MIVVIVGIVLVFPGGPQGPTGAAIVGGDDLGAVNETIKIGIQTGPANTLVMVAEDKGFFDSEGLDVELVEFTGGKFALQALFAGSLDMAVSGEVPVTLSSMQGIEFYAVSQVVEKTVNEVRLVALRDGDLNDPKSYFTAKKRKLATSFNGGPEFYTYNFLKKYNITDVEIISQKPEDTPAAIISGSVDAIVIFDPFAFIAESKLGEKAITFKDDSMYSELYVLNARRDWTLSHSAVVEKVLRALSKASEYVEANPEESKAVLMRYTKMDKETVDAIWNGYEFKPALNELLLKYLNEEAEWAKETGKVDKGTTIPDFQEYVYSDALSAVNPDFVTI